MKVLLRNFQNGLILQNKKLKKLHIMNLKYKKIFTFIILQFIIL